MSIVQSSSLMEGRSHRDWSFEFLWTRLIDGRGLIGLFGSVGGSRRRPLSKAHAAAARSGGPVPRTGPDLPRVVGTRRNASKSRNRRASASLTKPGVSVAALRQPPGRTNAKVDFPPGAGGFANEPSTTLALSKGVEEVAGGSVGNDKEPQAERTAWR